MTKMPIKLQDLRRKIYTKAKAEPEWRFWGIYVHVCKMETLEEAYKLTKKSNGAPGIDGVTFKSIEAESLEKYLQQIRHELTTKTYSPNRNRRKEIPKVGGKLRTLNIPTIRMDCTQVQSIFGIYYYHSSISSMEWATFSNIIDKELQEPGYI
ncbi:MULTISPECIES: reverse transcriptase family protein [unclassified Wolbachia]|uniref:hypothetical protein n=1 Tax=unclassified Wolbachia TaxID=2640676 RepID=UPI0021F8B8F9|nr:MULTISPECIES: hypothetical protein [unclassified Wolbachia]